VLTRAQIKNMVTKKTQRYEAKNWEDGESLIYKAPLRAWDQKLFWLTTTIHSVDYIRAGRICDVLRMYVSGCSEAESFASAIDFCPQCPIVQPERFQKRFFWTQAWTMDSTFVIRDAVFTKSMLHGSLQTRKTGLPRMDTKSCNMCPSPPRSTARLFLCTFRERREKTPSKNCKSYRVAPEKTFPRRKKLCLVFRESSLPLVHADNSHT